MKVLITGADGFIGRNLRQHLSERSDVEMAVLTSSSRGADLLEAVRGVEFVFHLAGANRPADPAQHIAVNRDFTQTLCDAVQQEAAASGSSIPVLLASSAQAGSNDGLYAQSKRAAELILRRLDAAHVFRLPNVFGKWCRPNYNSVVATFCWNTARGLPIDISDPRAPLRLVYVDDVVARFVQLMDGAESNVDYAGFEVVSPTYDTTVGALADQIRTFGDDRARFAVAPVGSGFLRALHATYLSYLPEDRFAYPLKVHADQRGQFVEVLKTENAGQFSYFTALPGVTRGGHYHHTKTEKFLVLRGRARFKFRHVQDGRTHELLADGAKPEVVETVPGWAHDVTNVGADELVVMLWSSEVFDPARPDTYSHATS
jgi:UDP-2-acetamido-2,6-beta-L-arabino-hexul-4-ose reductase